MNGLGGDALVGSNVASAAEMGYGSDAPGEDDAVGSKCLSKDGLFMGICIEYVKEPDP